MKNKILLGIAAVMIVSGIVLLNVNSRMYGGEWYDVSYSTDDTRAETVTVDDSFDSIEIVSDSRDVYVEHSEDGNCTVTAPQGGNIKTKCEIEADAHTGEKKLVVFIEDQSKWYEHITVSTVAASNTDIIVRLPENEYRSLSIVNGSGSSKVEEGFRFENAEVTNASGSIEFYADVKDSLTLVSVSGSVNAEDCRCDTVNVSVTSGSIELSDIVCRSLEISSISGSVAVEDSSANATVINAVSGSIRLDDFETDSLSVDTVSGSVTLPRKLRSVTEFETVSGSIDYE